MIDAEELTPVISAMQAAIGGSIEQVKEIFLMVFLFAHGYASIIANNSLAYDEELIKIAKDNLKSAIIISSVTFGVGHLVNLFNGSGMDLVSNLCQICFAIAVGFLLVTIFYRGGSLLPCIITHSAINTLSTFANEVGFTVEKHMIRVLVMIVLTVAYTFILTKTLPKRQ